MKIVLDTENPISKANVDSIFGTSENQDEFRLALLATRAHLLGFMHSARAVFDVFAFLVNILVLEDTIAEDKCYVTTIAKNLPASKLKLELDSLVKSEGFLYVNAFVNTSKHRSLIATQFTIDFDGPWSGVKIGSFEYKSKPFPARRLEELLQDVIDTKNRVITCCNLLNSHVLNLESR